MLGSCTRAMKTKAYTPRSVSKKPTMKTIPKIRTVTRRTYCEPQSPSSFRVMENEKGPINPATGESVTEEELKIMQFNYKNRTPALQKLDQIVKQELFENETPEKIKDVWNQFHKNKYCLSAVLSKEEYHKIKIRVKAFPHFVVPIPRTKQKGTEFFYFDCKADPNQWMFARLIEYKVKGAESTPALKLQFYPELLESKGLVLMRGEINGFILTQPEAQTLVNQIQLCYLDEDRMNMVRSFNKFPEEFDYAELLRDLPMLQ